MLKLYGAARSNYFRLAKALVVFKGLEYEEVTSPPSQEDDYLARSPMGKIPCLEVDGRFLSETLAIANYLEAVQPTPPLLPSDPFTAAKSVELACHVKFDVELVARRLLPAAYFGQSASQEVIDTTAADLRRGMAALARLVGDTEYAVGDAPSLADFYCHYTFVLSADIANKVLDVDVLADYPQIAALLQRIAQIPAIAEVEASAAS